MSRASNFVTKPIRLAIYNRDDCQCIICGERDINKLSLDHIVAEAKGGTHATSNLVTMCISCNSSKRDMPLKAFCMKKGYSWPAIRAKVNRAKRASIDTQVAKQAINQAGGWQSYKENSTNVLYQF